LIYLFSYSKKIRLKYNLPISIDKKFILIVITLTIVLVVSSTFIGSWSVTTTRDRLNSSSQGKVFVMYAASLLKIFENTLGPSYHNETGYTYEGEGRGSVQVANMILDGLRTPDVFVSAGTIPIMKLINSTNDKPPLAQWLVKFASAEMGIAYSPTSHYYTDLEKARIGETPWHKVLSKQGLKFGRTDPELDPKGYYMILTAKLSNIYYNDSTIKQRILGDDRNPKQLFPEETLKTTLESGQLDAVAAYKHEAISRGLPYITLPAEINLAHPTFSDFYRKASYTLTDGHRVFGGPIYFSATISGTAKNLNGAVAFVKFLLSSNGERILKTQGLNYLKPVLEGDIEKVPSSIRNILEPIKVAS
jgi:molybdate/tungstate transport system substrate-binding protein